MKEPQSFSIMAEVAIASAAVQATVPGAKPSCLSRVYSAGPVLACVLSEIAQVIAIVTTKAEVVVVLIASVVNILIAPIIIYFTWMKKKFSTLRELINKLNDELGKLSEENELFTERVDNLGEAVSGLKEFEGALSSIAKKNGRDVNAMVKLVKESEKVNAAQRACVKKQARVDVTRVVLDSFDSSVSNVYLDDAALEHFMLALGTVDKIVIVNEDEVRDKIKATSRSLIDILRLANTMVEEEGDRETQEGDYGVQISFQKSLPSVSDELKQRKSKRHSSLLHHMDVSEDMSSLFEEYEFDESF